MSSFVEIKNYKIRKSQISHFQTFEREISQVAYKYSPNANHVPLADFSDIWLDKNNFVLINEYSNQEAIARFNNRFANQFAFVGDVKKEFCLNIFLVQGSGISFIFDDEKQRDDILKSIEE